MVIFWIWAAFMSVYLVLWIRALAQIVRTPDHGYRRGNQVVWAAVVLLLPFLGLIIYHATGSPRKA